jgi:heme A synthase
VIPRPKSIATIVEFTHRATSGFALLLVVAELVWAFKIFPARHPVRRGAAASMLFMVTEALIGAGLVLFELVAQNASLARAAWMSAHLMNTFLLVAALTCTVFWASGGARLRLHGQGAAAYVLAFGLLAAMGVGVTGALAALGDTLFPATSLREGVLQDLSPTAHVLLPLRALHPVVAAVAAAYLFFAASFTAAQMPSPRVTRYASWLKALIAVQIGAGLVNLFLLAPIWMQLVHLLLADLLWMALVLLAASALGETAPEAADAKRAADAVSPQPPVVDSHALLDRSSRSGAAPSS